MSHTNLNDNRLDWVLQLIHIEALPITAMTFPITGRFWGPEGQDAEPPSLLQHWSCQSIEWDRDDIHRLGGHVAELCCVGSGIQSELLGARLFPNRFEWEHPFRFSLLSFSIY